MPVKRTFPDLFTDPTPALLVKFDNSSNEEGITVPVKNIHGPAIDKAGTEYLATICKDERIKDLYEFYKTYDGLELCRPAGPDNAVKRAMLKFVSAANISKFTEMYADKRRLPFTDRFAKKGEHAWAIDLNKTKTLYRGAHKWIAFAQVGDGPSCLTIFLEGENAGCVYLVAPQPEFNILKPIAKSFTLLLDRIAKDPAAFLKLVRSYVSLRREDGYIYGYVTVEYLGGDLT